MKHVKQLFEELSPRHQTCLKVEFLVKSTTGRWPRQAPGLKALTDLMMDEDYGFSRIIPEIETFMQKK